MRKILIVGPLFYGYSKSVARAFEKNGFIVELFDDWKEGTIENLREKIVYNLTSDKETFFNKKYEKYNVQIRHKYSAVKPDMVFIIRGAILTKETLLFMKKSKLVLWMMDSIFTVKRTLDNIGLYDHVFLFEREDIPFLKNQCNIDAHFLPLALDQSVYYPVENKHKPIDILFVGALYEDRIKLLRKITERFADKNVKIYGVYFSKLRNLRKFLFRKDKRSFTNKTLKPSELNIKYSEAKICINMHHSQSVYGVNQRFFELSGAKALQLCDRRGFVEDNFTNEQVLLYSSEEHLFELIEKVLPSYESYENMKNAVYTEVVNKHTFFCRIKKVIEVCQLQS